MSRADVTVGLLHPGRMGAAVAAQLRTGGTRVLWDPAGRSAGSAARAGDAGLEPAEDLADLVRRSDLVLSLCPPAAAETVARQVADLPMAGTVFVEANAISPRRMLRIAGMFPQAVVVDAAVVGPPPGNGERPRLYVSGPPAATRLLAELFTATDVEVRSLGEEIGKASALKLSYGSYNKTSRVLAAVSYALADASGVGEELLDIAAQRPGSYLAEATAIPTTAARAWRWGPEMVEAAELLAELGLPDELMRAAAAVLSRWDEARDTDLSVPDALARLRRGTGSVTPPL